MSPKHARPRPRLRAALLTPVALIASSALVYQASNAAFTATTSNGSNTWATGALTLADNDSGNALFQVTGLVPGSTGTKCIKVDYTATVGSNIKLYVNPAADDGLAQYLDMKVDEGTGAATNGSCTDFSSTGNLVTDTLKNFSTNNNSYANGLGSWSPTGNDTRTYRFTYTLNAGAPDSVQGKSSSATFVWEAKTS